MNKNKIDLIQNNPKKAFLVLTSPLIISSLMSTFNNLIDTLWIVNLGVQAIMVMGIITPIFIIITKIGNSIGVGANSIISRSIGANNDKKAKSTVFNAIFLGILFSILLPLISIPFMNTLLYFVGLKECFNMAYAYLLPILLGACFLIFLPLLNQISNSQGLTKLGAKIMIASNLINIILDPILIYVVGWGMFGASIATLIGNAFAIGIFIFYLFTNRMYLDISLKDIKLDFKIMSEVIKIGIPVFLDSSFIFLNSFILNLVIMNFIGPTVLVAYTIIGKIQYYITVPTFSMGHAITIVSGHLSGAKKFDEILNVIKFAIKVSILLLFIFSCILLIFYDPVTFLFVKDSIVINQVFEMFIYLLPALLFLPIPVLSSYLFDGLGKSHLSLFLTIITFSILIIMLIVVSYGFGLSLNGLYWVIFLSELIPAIVALTLVPFVLGKYNLNKFKFKKINLKFKLNNLHNNI